MITFNLQAPNKNYYRGHRPSNTSSNCWASDVRHALVLTIEQSRRLIGHSSCITSGLHIIVSVCATPIPNLECDREMFCLDGGYYYDFDKRETKEILEEDN